VQIQTANGPIGIDDLGATLMHEHLVIAFAGWESDTAAPVRTTEDLVRICVDHIEELKAAGFSSLLDPCPNDLGRDPELYAEVAARTGFNILFATGIYNEHLGGAYWRFRLDFDPSAVEQLAAMYVKELTEGVGPSRLRPAVIKLAIDPDPDTAFCGKVIKAAAMAANATGAPILTHTEGVAGDLLLDKLKALGVPAHRVIVGHSCGSSDKAYHRRIVDGGGYIGFDRFGLEWTQTDVARTECLHSLLTDGYAQQLIVSHDCGFCQRGQALPDAGLITNPLHFTQNIAPRLRDLGVAQASLDSLFTDNPRRYFCDEVPVREAALRSQPVPAE
jgi:phosphotriesterase-related protein